MSAILRRIIQGVVLLLFLTSIWFFSSFPFAYFFILFDPLAAVAWSIAAREVFFSVLPAIAVIISAIFFGRIFCGYICPMGTTIDLAGTGVRFLQENPPKIDLPFQKLHHIKYLLLIALLGAAVFGVNLYHWFAPIPLITKFYATLIQPFTALIGNIFVGLGQPIFSALNLTGLEYWQVTLRRFDGIYFVFIFFGIIFLSELLRPRFWCRYVCPAGAMLGLFSKLPLWRRRINKCTQCGVCPKNCPTNAITPQGKSTAHSECITCLTCVDICPVKGVGFSFRNSAQSQWENILPKRRAFLVAAGGGAGFAALEFLDLRTVLNADGKGSIYPNTFVRPPGAIPEREFLAACIRCGFCMRVCPSNGLQPATSRSGANFGAKFSPVLVSRRGACEPDCNLCGTVCPTGAILELPLEEKRWAKIGTAVINQGRCVAWASDKSCMVCQEVCPYGAVNIVPISGNIYPVPKVNANRCFGCGYCEQHCPAKLAAIAVEPLDTLRLSGGSFEETARERGLQLDVLEKSGDVYDSLFLGDLDDEKLPPGFSE